LPRPPNQRRHQSIAKCRPAQIVGWQVSRKRSSLEQSFAAALALGRGPAARKRLEQAKQLP
jgi:hypothetical protein